MNGGHSISSETSENEIQIQAGTYTRENEAFVLRTFTQLRGVLREHGWKELLDLVLLTTAFGLILRVGGKYEAFYVLSRLLFISVIPVAIWILSRSKTIRTKTMVYLFSDYMVVESTRNHFGVAEKIYQIMNYADVEFWMCSLDQRVIHIEGKHFLIKQKDRDSQNNNGLKRDKDAIILSSFFEEDIDVLWQNLMERIERPVKMF